MRLGTVEGGHHAWTRMGPHSSRSRKGTLRCYIDVVSKDNESVAVKPPKGQPKERPRWSQQHVAALKLFHDSAEKAMDTAMDGAIKEYAAHFTPLIPVHLMHQISFTDVTDWLAATQTPMEVDGHGLLTEKGIQSLKDWKSHKSSRGKRRKGTESPKAVIAKRQKKTTSGQPPNKDGSNGKAKSFCTDEDDEAHIDALLTGRLDQSHDDWAYTATLLSRHLSRVSGIPVRVGEEDAKTVYQQLKFNGKPIIENPRIIQLVNDAVSTRGYQRPASFWSLEDIEKMEDSCPVQ
ncbi:uncharacterized protein N0V89_006155 [Didymosphaeria variabile]|uniref:Uncharacterized protein n=1 Tax=Didymosphaeria variabile TaxID=1932322 RepID=A0A9W8XN19_9PLEO|nr:uncharacterized protein N0V89_006155 [Didymosphaeria variabile]KAJ4354419.1 hypothetical protein N0V89_006155 [Didymosphaeria variabile]